MCEDMCKDCAWSRGACEEGYKCNRLAAAYWQCEPKDKVKKEPKMCPAAKSSSSGGSGKGSSSGNSSKDSGNSSKDSGKKLAPAVGMM